MRIVAVRGSHVLLRFVAECILCGQGAHEHTCYTISAMCLITSQVYTLNTDAWKWTEHTSEVEGEAPSPRYGHCALALPDDRHLATFGGCDSRQDMFFSSVALLDTLTWRWSTPKIQVSFVCICSALLLCPFIPQMSLLASEWL
jgi:hypothetical protein